MCPAVSMTMILWDTQVAQHILVLACMLMIDLDTKCEIVWVTIKIQGSKDVTIGAFYRSPQFGATYDYMNELRESINKMKRKNNEHIWLAGRVGVNSAPELDFLANSKSNSGIGIELELALPSPGGIGIELELPSFELELESDCVLRNWIRNCLHGIEIQYEVPHISVAYYSRRLAQVVYTLLVHIDSTKEIRGQLCIIVHTTMKL